MRLVDGRMVYLVPQVLLFLGCLQSAAGRAYIETKFTKYSANCREDASTSNCDPMFTFCYDRPSTRVSVNSRDCEYGTVGESGYFQDDNNIDLGSLSSIKGIPNPWLLPVAEILDPDIMLVTRIRDDDIFGDDHLVTWSKILTETVYPNRDEAVWASRGMSKSEYNLYFNIRVYCDANYYLSNCTKFCKGEDLDTGHYTCDRATGDRICMRGWKGEHCTEDIDECAEGFCERGSCENLIGDYVCHCPVHYTGKNCTNIVNQCDASPCQNNGTCVMNYEPYGYTCKCAASWEGENCEERADPCHVKTNPCKNGASCFSNDDNTAYSCDCKHPFTGMTCETNLAQGGNGTNGTELGSAHTGGANTGAVKSDDTGGFEVWMGIVIALILLIIIVVIILIFLLMRRRRRRKEKEMKDGLPPGDTIVVFNGGDNLAFENGMYNDVLRDGSARNNSVTETPTTPSDDDLFNPVKPTFQPDDVDSQGAVGGGYHDMDADGYVKPMPSFHKKSAPTPAADRAMDNNYADFNSIAKRHSVDEKESHYQDLDEMAITMKVFDDAVEEGQGGKEESPYSDVPANIPILPAPRPKVPPKPQSNEDSYDNMPGQHKNYPGTPLEMINPLAEMDAQESPKYREGPYSHFSLPRSTSSDPFADNIFLDDDDDHLPDDISLPSVPDDGGYTTPTGSQRKHGPPLTSQTSHYDSPKSNQPSARTSTTSDYDSPRSSAAHRPTPPPPKVAPKPPTRTISSKTHGDSYENVDMNEDLPPAPPIPALPTQLDSGIGYETDDVDANMADNGDVKAADMPQPINVRNGYSFEDDDDGGSGGGRDDVINDDDHAQLQTTDSSQFKGLFLENHGFSHT